MTIMCKGRGKSATCFYFDFFPLDTMSVLILLFSTLWLAAENRVIHVDYNNGSNDESCLNEQRGIACQSLDYALNSFSPNESNMAIMIASGKQYLDTSVTVSGVSNLLIEGGADTLIECEGNGGIEVIAVTELTIKDVTFSECAFVHNASSDVFFRSAIHILNSTNVMLCNVDITNSPGFGLALVDTGGTVIIENSNFRYNRVPQDEMDEFVGGGGVYIEFSTCSPGFDTLCESDDIENPFSSDNNYTILNCSFESNNASLSPPDAPITYSTDNGPSLQSFGRGGGLSLSLKGTASRNVISIKNCKFFGNGAIDGGGLSVNIDDLATNNTIFIGDDRDGGVSILKNRATRGGGGGGLVIGFFNSEKAHSNKIIVRGVTFDKNWACYGGGVSLYSTRMPYGVTSKLQNRIGFHDCIWRGNTAEIGAAVVLFPEDWTLISDGYLPTPTFEDCRFVENSLNFENKRHFSNGGVISSHTFSLNLSSSIEISHNGGSGMHILTGDIRVLPNTVLNITNNTAVKGGGLMLMNFASIIAHNGSSIIFRDNNASDVGGAIYYYSSDTLDFVNSRRCFIRYNNGSNTKISFVNNDAVYGKAIYAESLRPCTKDEHDKTEKRPDEYFLGDPFHFEEPNIDAPHTISTSAKELTMETYQCFSPGIIYPLNINVTDDMGENVDTILLATCDEKSKVKSQYKYLSEDYKMAINGKINTNTKVTLQTTNARSLGITLNITLLPCPPGYVLSSNEESCICSVTEKPIPGIVACNDTTNNAILKIGYWAGCNDNGTLLTAQCPLGYCDYGNVNDNGLVTLPSKCKDLNESQSLCSENRNGTVCGECATGYSVHYHSTRFICRECHENIGALYYILSELLPLTVLFIFVIYFDVSVTSGSVNSFILFVQVLDFFQVTAFHSYDPPKAVSILNEIYWFVFGFLNLDFFRLDQLSFCIWDGMNVLQVLVFKYVTSLYGLFLLFCLFIMMKFCKPLRRCLGRGNADGRYSIVHGITTLMIITYSQITKVSFQILTRVELCEEMNKCSKKVVFLSGGTEFMTQEHLYYAIPAMLVVIYAVLLPLILIAHPFYLMGKKLLLDKDIMQEKERVCCSCCSTNLGLLFKPTTDSLQSCFKDNMRFFAGLFFLYRLLSSASFAFSTTAMAMYSLLEVLILVMLTANAIFQPYQKKFHNILDTLMFADLAIINGMSLYNFASTQYMTDQESTNIIASIQVVLIYIPLFYVAILLSLKLLAYKFRSVRYKLRHLNTHISIYDPRMLEQDQHEDRLRNYRQREQNEDEEQRELVVSDNRNRSFNSNRLPARLFEEESERDLRRQGKRYGTAMARYTK